MTALQPTIDGTASADVSRHSQITPASTSRSRGLVKDLACGVRRQRSAPSWRCSTSRLSSTRPGRHPGRDRRRYRRWRWISTSYLIAEIIVIPLSGWLAQVFSIRVYLLTNAILFLAFSAACALAQDLPHMIVLRALAGLFAAAC